MEERVSLPSWLDDYLFKHLGAYYKPEYGDLAAIDWGVEQLRAYLGTYFPRSYVEAYSIFSQLFGGGRWSKHSHLSVYDFACGTGGELLGFLRAVDECLPHVACVEIKALDGNSNALSLLESILLEAQKHHRVEIVLKPSLVHIEDVYDLSLLDEVVQDKYDVVMTSKAICEFVGKDCLEVQRAYVEFLRVFGKKLKPQGVVVMTDVASPLKGNCWCGDLMDKAIQSSSARLLARNSGNNQQYLVMHSRQSHIGSKLVWRAVAYD